VTAYETASGRRQSIGPRAVVLATGGAGGLYARHDNPAGSSVKAMRSPCGPVRCCRTWNSFSSIRWGLLSPGLPRYMVPPRLGDYGRLYNAAGESIYEKYGIDERPAAEKARDRLSQALFRKFTAKAARSGWT